MSWSGRNVTVKVGGTPIGFSKSIEASYKAIPTISTRMISFNSNAVRDFDSKAEFNGRLKHPNGDELNLKSMKISNSETPFDYSFDVGSISIKKVMKTKGKQPIFIQVWVEF